MQPPGRATVIAALAFLAGLLLPPSPAGWLPLAGAILAGGAVLLPPVRRTLPRLHSLLLLACFVLLGWGFGDPAPAPQLPSERVWVQGTVRIPVEQAVDNRLRYRLSLHRWWAGDSGGPLDLGAVLYLPAEQRLTPGEDVRLIARLDPLREARNPGDFNSRGYWSNRNVQVRLRHVRVVEPLGVQRVFGGWTRQLVGSWRHWLDSTLDRHLTPATAPLARALITGDRSAWDNTLHDRLSRSGLMHLFAISGLHVGILLLILLNLLSWLGLGPRRTALLALPFLWLMVPLTGSNPPVLRATVILTAILIGRGLQRETDSFHLLALACIALLVIHPGGLHDVGFQLSFAGAAGSLWAGRHFRHLLSPVKKHARWWRRLAHRIPRTVLLALIVSCFAWLATAPILIVHFGRIALLGPLVTLPALLLVHLALWGGWAMAAFAWLPPLAATYGAAMDLLLRGTSWLSGFSARSVLVLDQLPASAAGTALLVLALAMALTVRLRSAPLPGLSLAAVGAGVIVTLGSLWLPDPAVKIAVLDVGQGDGVLIRSGRHAVLIDSGTPYSTAAADQCRRLGIRRLDLLLLSHGDADHSGAVPALLEHVDVGAALVGPATGRDHAGRAAIAALQAAGVPVHVASAGLVIGSPVGRFRCLHPLSPAELDSNDPRGDNELSAVWLWEKDGVRAMFAGDIPVEVEDELLRQEDLPEVNLVVAGHHGSRSSTGAAWLAALNPEWVAVSCGYRNPHGHPSEDVVERVQRSGAELLRTDQQGALLFRVNGSRLERISAIQWW